MTTHHASTDTAWVLVPAKPDEAMLRAGQASFADGTHLEALNVYRAMIAAAPQPEKAGEEAPVAWTLVFSEALGVNASTTFKTLAMVENYRSQCADPKPRVVPLFLGPPSQEAVVSEGEDAGNHDCLAKRRPGEPWFILLGRDPDAHNLTRAWGERRLAAGGDPEHCQMGLATAERMKAYAADPANRPASAPPAEAYPPLPDDAMLAALGPFASIGEWLFARDLPDDTVMVEVTGLHKPLYLTRGMFKAAHLSSNPARQAYELSKGRSAQGASEGVGS